MPVAKIFYCPEIGWSQSFSVLEQGWCFLPIRSSHLWNRVAAIYSWPWTGLLLSSPYLLQGCHNLLSTLKRVATIFSVPGTGLPLSSPYLEQGCHYFLHSGNRVANIFSIPGTGSPQSSPQLESPWRWWAWSSKGCLHQRKPNRYKTQIEERVYIKEEK